MAKRDSAPEVNAGSMADIAFLLLIFFLVTTTIGVDQGINRLLPRYEENPPVPPINERNILPVLVNKDNQLLVNEQVMKIKDLRQAAINFLENNEIFDMLIYAEYLAMSGAQERAIPGFEKCRTDKRSIVKRFPHGCESPGLKRSRTGGLPL